MTWEEQKQKGRRNRKYWLTFAELIAVKKITPDHNPTWFMAWFGAPFL
jgi:hypothetical protein